MIGLRPKASNLFLERPRLLRMLPEEAGYVIWLEAPYGYGKSVLTSQWATRLEADAWRVVWISLLGEEPRGVVARALELPTNAPWSVVLEALWSQPTLVILEDLEGAERLSPLLKSSQGLVLLSSRGKLSEPEVPRLMAEGRLVHLTSAGLAFNKAEALSLFQDQARATAAWEITQGWSLPLHLAALTGEVPERQALIEGMRESLALEVWQEALLLSSLNVLPLEAATSNTKQLAESGFAQALETGFRLHPLAAETVLEHHEQEVKKILIRESARLPVLTRGLAFEKLGMRDALLEIFEGDELSRQDPHAFVRWDESLGGSSSIERSLCVGDALCLTGRKTEGIARLLQVVDLPDATPNQRLRAYREALWNYTDTDLNRAKELEALARPLLELVTPDQATAFLNYSARIDFIGNDFLAAEAKMRQSLSLIPPEAPKARRSNLLQNIAVFRWYRLGDLEGQSRVLEELLGANGEGIPALQAGAMYWNLGYNAHLLGDNQKALEHFQKILEYQAVRPLIALKALAFSAVLKSDWDALPAIMARIALWEDPVTEDVVLSFWALHLVNAGQYRAALERLNTERLNTERLNTERVLCQLMNILALHKLGQAVPDMPPQPEPIGEREVELHWYSVDYRVTGNLESFEKLLGLTLSHERILPALIPLLELPKNRPETSQYYPLQEVLASGWKDAIKLRLPEIPKLEIQLLGRYRVKHFEQEITLTLRPKESLALLVTRATRDQISDALWTDLEPKSVRNNLHVTLNALRKSLEPWGVASFLNEEGLTHARVDVWELEVALERNDAEQVLNLYQGKFAPGMDIMHINETRDHLHERVIACLERHARNAAPERAENYCERILELEPLMETAMNLLLEILVKSGRKPSAKKRLKAFQQKYKNEMGFEPMLETQMVIT
jgi:DNA-binding SARP family transcriptional activator